MMGNDKYFGRNILIPIVIDSVKISNEYNMTRCTYFSIENSEPSPGWQLTLETEFIPFLMIGLSGVITSPLGMNGIFGSPSDFDDLFCTIEQSEFLYVDTNDVWLPNTLFDQPVSELHRGQVYRISHDLFTVAYSLADDISSEKYFFSKMEHLDYERRLKLSESETLALKRWNDMQIARNKDAYHEKSEFNLPKKGGQASTLE